MDQRKTYIEASRRVEEFADEVTEYELYHAIVGDETFGTLAAVSEELYVLEQYLYTPSHDSETGSHIEISREHVEDALHARAVDLKEQDSE